MLHSTGQALRMICLRPPCPPLQAYARCRISVGRTHERSFNFSRVRSQSCNILASKPVPMVSPACTGAMATRPSGTLKPASACPLSVPLATWAAEVCRLGGQRHESPPTMTAACRSTIADWRTRLRAGRANRLGRSRRSLA